MAIRTTEPSIAVVMPTFNRADSVAVAATRVLEQITDDDRLVIVDDGSTDHTAEVLASISDPRLTTVHRENGGISAARNSGVAATDRQYIVTLDDDDIPKAGWIEGLRRSVSGADVDVASCGCEVIDVDDGRLLEVHLPKQLGPVFSDYVGFFLAGTFIVDRELYLDVGGFAEGLQCSHQTEFAMRVLDRCRRLGKQVGHVDEPLLQVVRRTATDRPESSPEKLRSGSVWILENRAEYLDRDRSSKARFMAIAGVNSYKVGDRRGARRYLLGAAWGQPRNMRNWARALVAVVPPLARRTWCR